MKPTLSVVIVEDETRARDHLLGLLRQHHPEVNVLGSAEDVTAGVELVKRTHPQVIFLDIELKDRTAFELLRALGSRRPHVVFTTAHEGYAVKAIRFSALDYLLKPVNAHELDEALARAEDAVRGDEQPHQVDMLLRNIDRVSGDRLIAVPVSDGLELVHVNELVACESDSNYTTLHMRDGKRMVVSRPMKQFEELLPDPPFKRVHNCFLVNMKHIRRYVRGDGGELMLSNGMHVPVARRKKQELLDALEPV